MNTKNDKNTMVATDFFKALSEPTRLKLVLILREQLKQKDKPSLCVCDLIEILQQPQPTISRHLNHLKRVGVLTSEPRGTWMWYGINQTMPAWCLQVINLLESE